MQQQQQQQQKATHVLGQVWTTSSLLLHMTNYSLRHTTLPVRGLSCLFVCRRHRVVPAVSAKRNVLSGL
jgi:predicted metal-binding protein